MTKRLRTGDVLVKARGGASRRARVVRIWRWADGSTRMAELAALAPSVRKGGRNEKVKRWTVALGEDGLPPGWRRSTIEHDWCGSRHVLHCANIGCAVRKWPEGAIGNERIRYQRNYRARLVLTCPPCEGQRPVNP